MPQQETQQELVPGWKIKLDGSELATDLVPDVTSVEVEQHVDGADAFDLTVNVWDVVSQDFQWLDDGTFEVGRELEVLIGHGEDLESLIRGEIVALRVDYGAEMAPVLHVEGYDQLHRFRRGRQTQTFTNVKDSQVAEQIAQDMQLQAEVEDSRIVHAHLFQVNQSNVDFLRERARRIHYQLDVIDGTLLFRPAAHGRGKTTQLSYRDDLKSFSVRLSTQSQVKKVVVKGWNPAAKEAIVGLGQVGDEATRMGGQNLGPSVAADAFGDFEELILDRAVFDQSEADQIAKALFDHMSLQFIKAEGECIGNAQIRAGEVVEIGNLGQRLSGLYCLAVAHHVIDEEGYRSRLACQRNATSWACASYCSPPPAGRCAAMRCSGWWSASSPTTRTPTGSAGSSSHSPG